MMTQPDKTVFPESYWQIARLHRKCKFWVSCLVLNACRTAHCAVIFSLFPLCLFLRTGGLGINGFTKRRVTLLFCSSHEVYLRSGCPLNVSVWVDVSMCFREAGVGWGRTNVGCSQAPSERSWGGGGGKEWLRGEVKRRVAQREWVSEVGDDKREGVWSYTQFMQLCLYRVMEVEVPTMWVIPKGRLYGMVVKECGLFKIQL